jgi:hypothetical protein
MDTKDESRTRPILGKTTCNKSGGGKLNLTRKQRERESPKTLKGKLPLYAVR